MVFEDGNVRFGCKVRRGGMMAVIGEGSEGRKY